MNNDLWTLRPANRDDLPFILSSWLKTYRRSHAVSGVPDPIFSYHANRMVSNLLSKPAAIVIVACDPTDARTIFGYIVAELTQDTLILHWVYVKHALRRFGISKALAAEMTSIQSRRVEYSTRCRNIRDTTWSYNPFALWRHISE